MWRLGTETEIEEVWLGKGVGRKEVGVEKEEMALNLKSGFQNEGWDSLPSEDVS